MGSGYETTGEDVPGLGEKTTGEDVPGLGEKTTGGDVPGLGEKTTGGDVPGLGEKTTGEDVPGLGEKTTGEDVPGLGEKTTGEDVPAHHSPQELIPMSKMFEKIRTCTSALSSLVLTYDASTKVLTSNMIDPEMKHLKKRSVYFVDQVRNEGPGNS